MLENREEKQVQHAQLSFIEIRSQNDFPPWTSVAKLTDFLHIHMKPYEDKWEDVQRGLGYALSARPSEGGFILLAARKEELMGATVFLKTGMKGYVPENLLLFICVRPDLRGAGIGEALIRRALAKCQGSVKLHVEPDNPALRLYERVGFTNKYLEMRYSPEVKA